MSSPARSTRRSARAGHGRAPIEPAPIAPDLTVADAMISRPKVFGPDVTVAELATFFADDHVHLALIVGTDPAGRLLATVVRDDLTAPAYSGNTADDHRPARLIGRLAGRVVSPNAALAPVAQHLSDSGRRRLAVVADDGTLVGLLCRKRSGRGFCSDADVLARSLDPDSGCSAG